MLRRKSFSTDAEYKIEDGINLILTQNSVADNSVISIQEVNIDGVFYITIFYRS